MLKSVRVILIFLSLSIDTSIGEVCYDRVGCFPRRDMESIVEVPYPESPEDIGTKFYFSTRRQNEMKFQWGTDLKSLSLDYNPDRITVVLLHDYLEGVEFSDWIRIMGNAFLKSEDVNFFLVDWSHGCDGSYDQAVSNTRLVGQETALLIANLVKEYQTRLADVHLIGLGLGAQVAGYTGRVLGNVGRITGLDPARINFEFPQVFNSLSKSDGNFVDVVHTDVTKFGMSSPVGHIDFYMNVGAVQPGCSYTDSPLNGTIEQIFCDHVRATEYFTEALETDRDDCVFWGTRYGLSHKPGELRTTEECNLQQCAPLGLKSYQSELRGSFKIITNSLAPFCQHYSLEEQSYKSTSKYKLF